MWGCRVGGVGGGIWAKESGWRGEGGGGEGRIRGVGGELGYGLG